MAIKYTDEEILNNLKTIIEQEGKVVKLKEYAVHPLRKYNISIFNDRFGSYKNALRIIGYKQAKWAKRKNVIPDKELIDNLILIAKDLGHAPSMSEYAKHPMAITTASCINSRFKNYSKALEIAGLTSKFKRYTKEEILQNLKEIAEDIGRCPTTYEYNNHPKSITTTSSISSHFKSFNNACEKAGLDLNTKQFRKSKLLKTTKTKIKNSLRKMAKQLGHTPTQSEYEKSPFKLIDYSSIWNYFKSYTDALKEAGLNKNLYLVSDKKLLDDLYNTALHNPKVHSIDRLMLLSGHCKSLYKKRFGNNEEIKKVLYMRYGIIIQKKIMYKERLSDAIKYFKQYVKEYGNIPLYRELCEYNPSIKPIIKATCKRYENFLYLNGYVPMKNVYDWSNEKEKLIKKIKQIYKKLKNNQDLTYTYFLNNAIGNGIKERLVKCFGSVDNALRQAHIPLKKNVQLSHAHDLRYTDEQLISILKNAAAFFGHAPLSTEYNKWKNKTASLKTFQDHFGSWTKAIAAAGMEPLRVKSYTDKQLIQYLQNIAEKIGHSPTQEEYKKNNNDNFCWPDVIRKQFGSWNNALIAANLQPIVKDYKAIMQELHILKKKKKEERIKNGFFDQEKQKIIFSIKAIADDINKVPTRRAYNKHPLRFCSCATVMNRFGSWDNALKAAGLK